MDNKVISNTTQLIWLLFNFLQYAPSSTQKPAAAAVLRVCCLFAAINQLRG
jgi:hypothetical protein